MISDDFKITNLEGGEKFTPQFDENGLLPVITSDYQTFKVLMFAYMNRESLEKTLKLGEAVYWSRSRKEIWHKGATSGHFQKIKEIRIDCDQDCLLLLVEQQGAACHMGYESCFYRSMSLKKSTQIGLLTWIESKK